MSKRIGDPGELRTVLSAFDWMGSPGTALVSRMHDACGQACQEWQQEIARFTESRLRADTEHVRRLAGCRSWAEVATLQHDYITAAGQDWAMSVAKLLRPTSMLGREDVGAVSVPARPTSNAAE